MSEKHPVAEAVRSEIVKLATEGDKNAGGALTADVLMRLVRVAKTGRELLVSLDASPSNLAGMVRRPSPSPISFGVGTPDGGNEESLSDNQQTAMATPFVYTPPSENFGMLAIREIISAAKSFNQKGDSSPSKLVEAIAIAREKGLDDVARELEGQLGIAQKPAGALVPKTKED